MKFVPYLKGSREAKHLKQEYDMFSLWRMSWEIFAVIWVRNCGGLNIMTVGIDKRAQT